MRTKDQGPDTMLTNPFHLRPILLTSVVALTIASVCAAQDEETEPFPGPAEFIPLVRDAYRAGPIGEHVTVRVTDSIGRRTTGRLKLFIHADSPGDPDANSAALRIEFDPLQVWWGGDTLTAISERNETIYYQENLIGKPDLSTISSALRPIPLPQLELAFSDDLSFAMPTPYTPGTIWTKAVLGTLGPFGTGGSEVVIIEGHSNGRAISFTIDPQTDRLRTMRAEIGPPEQPDAVVLDLEFRPIEPPPIDDWRIDTLSRTLVDRVIDLLPRRGPVYRGDISPEIVLFNEAMMPWRLGQTLDSLAASASPPHALALLLIRHNADIQTQEEFVVSAERAVAATVAVQNRPLVPAIDPNLIQPGTTSSWRVNMHAGAVFRLGDYTPIAYRQLSQRWASDAADEIELLWDPSPSGSIDWFDRDAGAVLVLVHPDHTLLLVEPLDASADADEIAIKIESALRNAYPAYSSLEVPAESPVDDSAGAQGPPLP